jgi:hypothetical protein
MNRESLIKAITVILLALLLLSCHHDEKLFVISSEKKLLLPLKASKFFGYFKNKGVEVIVDYAPEEEELINFLNFSKYGAIITTKEIAQKITTLSKKWKLICKVGIKISRGAPIKKEEYVLLVRGKLIRKVQPVVILVKGWNYGVELLKDPAVLYYLLGEKELKGIKLIKCQGK